MSGDNPVGFLMKVVKKERRVIISLFNEGSFFDSLEIPFISFSITITIILPITRANST